MALSPEMKNHLLNTARVRGYDEQKTAQFLAFSEKQLGGQEAAAPQAAPVEQPTLPPNPEPKKDGFFKSLIKDPIQTLIVKPATRVVQAAASPIVTVQQNSNSDSRGRLAEDITKLVKDLRTVTDPTRRAQLQHTIDEYKKELDKLSGQSTIIQNRADIIDSPIKPTLPGIGEFDVEAQKGGAQGVKQIAGDAAKTASYLYTPAAARSALPAAGATAGQIIKQSAIAGAKIGAVGGALNSGGESLIEGNDLKDVAIDTAKGALGGAAIGGAFGAATGGAAHAIENRLKLKEEITSFLKSNYSSKVDDITSNIPAAKTSLPTFTGATEKIAKEAVSKGITPEYIKVITEASPEDRRIMRSMFETAKKGSSDLVYRTDNRTIDSVGETFLNRIPVLQKARQEVGEKLGAVVKSMPKEPAPVNEVYKEFANDLAEASIGLSEDGKLVFARSAYKNDGAAQKLLQGMYDDLTPDSAGISKLTPQRINTIRQQIGIDLDLGSKGATSMSGNAERILTKVRASLGDVLATYSDDYAKLSAEYTSLSDVLQRTNSLLGRDFKINSSLAKLKAGEVMRRILSNVSAKPLQLVKDVDSLAKLYNKNIKGNVTTQMIFSDFLDDLFGLTQSNSLSGQVQKANENTLKAGVGIAEDIANKNIGNLLYKGVLYGVNKVKGITPERQQEIIERLLRN